MMSIRVLKYEDLAAIEPGTSNERFVEANAFNTQIKILTDTPIKKPNPPESVFMVRESVAHRLGEVSLKLPAELSLGFGYGLRCLSVQSDIYQRVFGEIKEKTGESDTIVREKTHQLIAVPEVSGHPTGGAVDVTLLEANGTPLDMGTPFLDINADAVEMSREAKSLSTQQQQNRALLTNLMCQAGFAPFWGEWWHYSYGDREWAAYYQQEKALYGQVQVNEILNL